MEWLRSAAKAQQLAASAESGRTTSSTNRVEGYSRQHNGYISDDRANIAFGRSVKTYDNIFGIHTYLEP